MDIASFLRRGRRASLTGVILAGGKKRHAGGVHPALLPFHREKMVNRQFRLMRPVCAELILVTDEPRLFLPVLEADVRLITDYYSNVGPLGGVHAALSLACHDEVWLAGCDMPFLSPQATLLMLDRKLRHRLDAVVPCINATLYPLHGVFGRSLAGLAANLAAAETHGVLSLLDGIRYDTMREWNFRNRGIEPNFIFRANTRETYEDALCMKS